MSELGSIKARLDHVIKELELETQKWVDAKLPPPGQIWRLGENEFMTHVHVKALDKVLRELAGADVVELAVKETFLEEMREARNLAQEARSSAIRQNIVNGIRPEL